MGWIGKTTAHGDLGGCEIRVRRDRAGAGGAGDTARHYVGLRCYPKAARKRGREVSSAQADLFSQFTDPDRAVQTVLDHFVQPLGQGRGQHLGRLGLLGIGREVLPKQSRDCGFGEGVKVCAGPDGHGDHALAHFGAKGWQSGIFGFEDGLHIAPIARWGACHTHKAGRIDADRKALQRGRLNDVCGQVRQYQTRPVCLRMPLVTQRSKRTNARSRAFSRQEPLR